MRTRKQFVRERTRHTQRIHKTLEDANIKLDSVLFRRARKSGRAMLERWWPARPIRFGSPRSPIRA